MSLPLHPRGVLTTGVHPCSLRRNPSRCVVGPYRAAWPWLRGWVVSVCGPDEWEICVQAAELATWHDSEDWYPTCFPDSSEIRPPEAQADREWPAEPELEVQ